VCLADVLLLPFFRQYFDFVEADSSFVLSFRYYIAVACSSSYIGWTFHNVSSKSSWSHSSPVSAE